MSGWEGWERRTSKSANIKHPTPSAVNVLVCQSMPPFLCTKCILIPHTNTYCGYTQHMTKMQGSSERLAIGNTALNHKSYLMF